MRIGGDVDRTKTVSSLAMVDGKTDTVMLALSHDVKSAVQASYSNLTLSMNEEEDEEGGE